MTHEQSRRRYYRFRYPISERPQLRIRGQVYAVTELSEGGLRFRYTGTAFADLDEIYGQLHFHDGSVVLVQGIVCRVLMDEVAVQLSGGVTLQRAIAEQRYLSRNYPGFPNLAE